MPTRFERNWDGEGRQRYAFLLVQHRHGASNVQRVPDEVRGDGGLEFFTTDLCLYQCFAPEETANVAKASSAMKRKATRDLQKLIDNQTILAPLLQGLRFSRWFLLCPFLDDKAVVAHTRQKGLAVRSIGLPYLSDDFEALVKCPQDFAAEIEGIRQEGLGPLMPSPDVGDTEVDILDADDLSATLDKKLRQAYPSLSDAGRSDRRREFLRNHIRRGNLLTSLKREHPILWERAFASIDAEERRLAMLGSEGATPRAHLTNSLLRIEQSLASDLGHLPKASRTDISSGTLSDWLMRCPLNFEDDI